MKEELMGQMYWVKLMVWNLVRIMGSLKEHNLDDEMDKVMD